MNIYENFTNMYQVNKTIRMGLKPICKTDENIAKFLEEDKERSDKYKIAKEIIDKENRAFIEDRLKDFSISGLDEYLELLKQKKNLTKNQNEMKKEISKQLTEVQKKMRNEISTQLEGFPKFDSKYKFRYITDKEDIKILEDFKNKKFTTYFKGFNDNRKNVYSKENISTSIGHRVVHENLPKFISNFRTLNKAIEVFGTGKINEDFKNNGINVTVEELIKIDYFNKVLTQSGIDLYNNLIGILNQNINLYNQQQKVKKNKIGKLEILYKQILSKTDKVSFIEEFTEDNQLLECINEYFKEKCSLITVDLKDLLENIDTYNLNGIFIKSDKFLGNISNYLYKDWWYISNLINEEYDYKHKNKVRDDKYYETRKKAIDKIKYFSIGHIDELLKDKNVLAVENYFKEKINLVVKEFNAYLNKFNEYKFINELKTDEIAVEIIKNLCDSIKNVQGIVKPLIVMGNDKDDSFYGDINYIWDELNKFNKIYNMVRNYLTKKDYIDEKIRLTFNNPQLLGGWSYNKESDYSSFILKDNKYYYLAIMNPNSKSKLKDLEKPENDEDTIYKMKYYQASDPAKSIPNLMVINGKTKKKNGRKVNGENIELERLRNEYLPTEINEIRKSKAYLRSSSSFSDEALIKYIDYYKERVKEYFNEIDFKFKETCEYKQFNEFAEDVNLQAYQISFIGVSKKYIKSLIDDNKIYLFKIYNKDFSENSKGIPNLHTLYFKMLFDKENLENPIYKLSGNAEMFFRKGNFDLDKTTIHHANKPINNKNPNNRKKQSVFKYDIIKNRRYTVDKFALHMSITTNFQVYENKNVNETVNRALKYCDDIYAIGIDRGERNLLYACVVNSRGEIVKQVPLNFVGNTDYHQLLAKKEEERMNSRKNWKIIDNIKNLKEGYLSQAIHIITDLMVEYNAVLVLENLNFRFKEKQMKFESNVYQKFEKMLIDKLNFLVDKKLDKNANGGLFNAYQLTEKFTNFKDMKNQNGIIFYIPAWMTSKIDPVTGFTNLFYIKYESIEKAKEFFGKFKSIKFNKVDNYFEFEFDYNDFTDRAQGTRSKWTVCSFGPRIEGFRNPEKNNSWDSREIDITEKIKNLLDDYNVSLDEDIKAQIMDINTKDFFEKLIKYFKLVLQMRNSKTGTDIDYIISPVKNKQNEFFDSRKQNEKMPMDADANGAYNIARKGLMFIDIIKETEDKNLKMPKLFIKNKDWLNYVQKSDL